MKYLLVAFCALLVVGCSDPNRKPDGWGEKRIELFRMCMELAKVDQDSTHYSPNQKVVKACSSEAFYMANGLTNSGYFEEQPQ